MSVVLESVLRPPGLTASLMGTRARDVLRVQEKMQARLLSRLVVLEVSWDGHPVAKSFLGDS